MDVGGRRRPGVFAAALVERLPLLPVVEEDALHDDDQRDHFLTRAYAHARVERLLAGDWSAGDLVRFHSAEKLLLLAHAPAAYASLGRLVSEAGVRPRDELGAAYREGVAGAASAAATPSRIEALALEHGVDYVAAQTYVRPYPRALMAV